MAEDKNHDELQRTVSRDSTFRGWLLNRVDLIIGVYLGVLIVLAYPASFVTLWVQLTDYYGFSSWRALYATSLVPATFVVGKIVTVFWFSLFTAPAVWVLSTFGAGYTGYKGLLSGYVGRPGSLHGSDDSGNPKATNTTKVELLLFRAFQLFYAIIVVFLPIVLSRFSPMSWFGFGTYLAYVLLVFLGAYLTFPITVRALQEKSRNHLFRGMVVAYAASILAAVALAGMGSPSLPAAEIVTDGQKQTVGLLSHSDGYWHVISQDNIIVHIPAEDVEGDVRVTGVTEKPGY